MTILSKQDIDNLAEGKSIDEIITNTEGLVTMKFLDMIERRAKIYTEGEPEYYALQELLVLARAKVKSKR